MAGTRHDQPTDLRADRHDQPGPLSAHGGKHGPDHAMATVDVGLEGQLRGLHVLQLDGTGHGEAGVVDQNVQLAARPVQHLGHAAIHGLVRCDVDLDHLDRQAVR